MRLSKRARLFLILALCLAVAASAAGLVISRQEGSQAQVAAPGSAQTRADLGRMQALLNSGSVPEQAALLVPGFQFAPGTKPIFPAGTEVTVEQATFRSDGRFGTVRASVSGSSPVTLGLYATGGHWRLYAVQAVPAQTRAATTRQPGGPVTAELTASTSSNTVKACPGGTQDLGNKVPVVFIHGFWGHASDWGSDSDPASMFYAVDMIPGTWTSAFDYSQTNGEWVDNPAIGPRFVTYLNCVAAASKAAGGPGKVIVIAHSMGGLVTRWAASNGAGNAIAEVITLGTPNTGAPIAGLGDAIRQLFCDTQSMLSSPGTGSFCTEFTALAGMADYSSQIANLPELPGSIPLHAIAGAQTIKDPLGGAWIETSGTDDLLAPVDSALHQPPGSSQFTTKTIACTSLIPFGPCWHGALPNNSAAQADVRSFVRTYFKAHYGPRAPAGQQPLSGHPAGPDGEDPLNVVYGYYDDLNAHQYQQAWELGGSNIAAQNGQTYDSWVAGYAGTAGLYITGQDAGTGLGNHLVQVSITVTQTDGSVRYYAGTYTVRQTDYQSWTITSADIHGTSGATPPGQGQAAGSVLFATQDWQGTQPSYIGISGDSTLQISSITWQSWGSTTATGTGDYQGNNCVPDCAGGSWSNTPATIVLSNPVNIGDGNGGGWTQFETMTVTEAGQVHTYQWGVTTAPDNWPMRAS